MYMSRTHVIDWMATCMFIHDTTRSHLMWTQHVLFFFIGTLQVGDETLAEFADGILYTCMYLRVRLAR